jgi:hypothetical protein
MLMISRAIACGFLLFSPCAYGQGDSLERRASDFNPKGVGLTETLLKFSHEEHLPIAIEYIDRASMERPIDVSLRNKTIRQALDSILLNGNGYGWKLRDGIIEITNRHGSKHAEGLLNKVIPIFNIQRRRDRSGDLHDAVVGTANCARPEHKRIRRRHHGQVVDRKGWNLAQPNGARDSFLHRSQWPSGGLGCGRSA